MDSNNENAQNTRIFDPTISTEHNSILKKLIGGRVEPEPDPSARQEDVSKKNSQEPSKKSFKKSRTQITRERRFNFARKLQSMISKRDTCIGKVIKRCKRICGFKHKEKAKKDQQKELLKSLMAMNDKYKRRQERVDYLWRKVRALVNSKVFIGMVKEANNQSIKRQQTGISDRRQSIIERNMKYQSELEKGYKCLIKYDSNFKVLWEFLIAASFLVSFWIIPLNMCTLFSKYSELQALEIFIDFTIIIDILVNLFSETLNKEQEVVIYLKDVIKIYLKSFFAIDVLSFFPNFIFWEQNATLYPLKILRFFRIRRFFKFFDMLDEAVSNLITNNADTKEVWKKAIKLLRLAFLYYMVLHVFACIFYYTGMQGKIDFFQDYDYSHDYYAYQGWILNDPFGLTDQQVYKIYLRAFYFIMASFATVGYGDVHAQSNSEYIFTVGLIMVCQLLFSFFSEKLRRIMLSSEKAKISVVKLELMETAKLFLVQFSRIKGARKFKSREIKTILEYLEASFQYNFKAIKQDDYFKNLSQNLKKKLINHLLNDYVQKFPYFFEDIDYPYVCSDLFKYGILSNLECQIVPQENIVIDYHESVKNVYFINFGGVMVYDMNDQFIVQYLQGSVFGDYQVLLGLKSQYRYIGSSNRTNYLFKVKGKTYLKYLYQDYAAFSYLTKYALKKRKYLKKISNELQMQFQVSYDRSPRADGQSSGFIGTPQDRSQSSQQNSQFQSYRTDTNGNKIKTQITLKVQQLLQIRSQSQQHYVNYFIEDLQKQKLEKVKKLMQMDGKNSSQSSSEYETEMIGNESEGSILSSSDEISANEEDVYTLPKNYKFYAERIQQSEKMIKRMSKMNRKAEKKIKMMSKGLTKLDSASLNAARQSLKINDKIEKAINDLVMDTQAKSLMRKFTIGGFGGIIAEQAKIESQPIMEQHDTSSFSSDASAIDASDSEDEVNRLALPAKQSQRQQPILQRYSTNSIYKQSSSKGMQKIDRKNIQQLDKQETSQRSTEQEQQQQQTDQPQSLKDLQKALQALRQTQKLQQQTEPQFEPPEVPQIKMQKLEEQKQQLYGLNSLAVQQPSVQSRNDSFITNNLTRSNQSQNPNIDNSNNHPRISEQRLENLLEEAKILGIVASEENLLMADHTRKSSKTELEEKILMEYQQD